MSRRCKNNAATVNLDPIQQLKIIWPGIVFPHITVNEAIRIDDCFFRYDRTSHDSTVLFSYQAMGRLLLPLVDMNCFKTSSPPDPIKQLFAIAYEVSMIRNCIVCGVINARCGRIPGVKESFRIYAKPRYVYDKDEAAIMQAYRLDNTKP